MATKRHDGIGRHWRAVARRPALVGVAALAAIAVAVPAGALAALPTTPAIPQTVTPAQVTALENMSTTAWNPLGMISMKLAGWGQAPVAGKPVSGVGAPGVVAPGTVVTPNAKISQRLMSSQTLLKLVRKSFPANEVGNAMAVADCESGQTSEQGDRNFDGTTDWGVFQLNDGGTLQSALAAVGHPVSNINAAQRLGLDAKINVKAAASIWRDRGWAPWTCAYKQQIVSALWSNSPGPMYGKFTVVGKPTGAIPTITKPDTNKKKPTVNKPKPAFKPAPKPAPSKPTPVVPTPEPTQTVCPSASPSSTSAPSPSC